MYTIGQFSGLSKVSTRRLRYYDKIGLFKPSAMGDNGYRYYTENDMAKISNIKQLRRYQFSLEEIDDIFLKDDPDYTRTLFQSKINYLKETTEEYENLISEMESQVKMVKDYDLLSTKNRFDILAGYRNEFPALCMRKVNVMEEEIERMIDELYHTIDTSDDLAAVGVPLNIFYEPYEMYDPEKTEIEVCIPINCDTKICGDLYTRVIEAGIYISTVFFGSYDKIGNAYIALIEWAKKNSYVIEGETVERYLKDKRDIQNQNRFITEICMPVRKSQVKQLKK